MYFNCKNYRYKALKMQIKYFKTENWNLKSLEQLEPCKMKNTQTLVVFKQNSLTDVNFYIIPDFSRLWQPCFIT